MDYRVENFLRQAEESGKFEHTPSEFLELWVYEHEKTKVLKPESRSGPLVAEDQLEMWLNEKAPDGPGFDPRKIKDHTFIGGLRLLIQRTRHLDKAKRPDKLPWKNIKIYQKTLTALGLPKTYPLALNHSAGIAEYHKTEVKSSDGRQKEIGLVGENAQSVEWRSSIVHEFIAQNTNYDWDSWSLALSYDAERGITTGFLVMDGADKKIDTEGIMNHLTGSKLLSVHPVLLPAIMFWTLKESNLTHLERVHQEVVKIEKSTGPGKGKTDQGIHEDQQLRDENILHESLSHSLNIVKKDHASRQGRHHFWRQFHERLLEYLDGVNSSASHFASRSLDKSMKSTGQDHDSAGIRLKHIQEANQELRQWISFNNRIFEFTEGRDINYGARIDAQLALLYSMISQRDTRAAEDLARKSSEDSSELKYIGYLGAVFLPANLIATLFQVEKWNMEPFWGAIYTVVTLPTVSIVAFILWFMPWWQDRCRRRAKEKADRDRGAPVESHSRGNSTISNDTTVVDGRPDSAASGGIGGGDGFEWTGLGAIATGREGRSASTSYPVRRPDLTHTKTPSGSRSTDYRV